ncbi:uncharacterized protein LOC144451006 [Glandiceps talaboti]
MVWTQPRSRSTVFELSMASVSTFKVYHEPYFVAYLFGEDREEPSIHPKLSGQSYADVIGRLEADYPENTAVIAKDVALFLRDMKDLPSGYIHTFLIRDPQKSIVSMYNVTKRLLQGNVDHREIVEITRKSSDMKPTWDLYKYVTQELKQKSIIIQSDELVQSPREILQKYCSETGLPFHESMLYWKPGNTSGLNLAQPLQQPPYISYYTTALSSSCFLPPSKSSTVAPDEEDIPTELLVMIKANQPIYDELYKNKLKI